MMPIFAESGDAPTQLRIVYPVIRVISSDSEAGIVAGILVILVCSFCLYHFLERERL